MLNVTLLLLITARSASDRFVWLAHVCGTNLRYTGRSITTLLANISKRCCSLLHEAVAHSWQFVLLLTYLQTDRQTDRLVYSIYRASRRPAPKNENLRSSDFSIVNSPVDYSYINTIATRNNDVNQFVAASWVTRAWYLAMLTCTRHRSVIFYLTY